MKKEFKILTEGVLIIASSSSLKSMYSNENFDYNFPSGITNLLKNNSLIALTTSGGNDLRIRVQKNEKIDILSFDKIIDQYLILQEEDEFLIMSHADFTMICDRKKGNYQKYEYPLGYVEYLDQGIYKITIGISDLSDDFDKHEAYYDLAVSIILQTAVKKENEIFEIAF